MLRIGAKQELLLTRKERPLSPDLLKGLFIALAFHLLLFTGIKITSPSNPEICAIITPVAVEIDLGAPRVYLPLTPQITLSPIERVEPPQLLELPDTQLIVEVPTLHRPLIHDPNFSRVEKIPYQLLEEEEEDDD